MWGGWNCAECWAQQPRAFLCPSNFPLPLMYTPHSCTPLGPTGVLSSRKAPHQLHRSTVVSPSQSLGWSPVTSHSWTGLKYSSSLQCTGSQVQKMGCQGWALFQAQSFPPCLLVSISFLFACLFNSAPKIRKYYLSCFHSALFLGDLQLSFSYVNEWQILNPARHPRQGLMPSPHSKARGCCSPMSSATMDCGTLSSFRTLAL